MMPFVAKRTVKIKGRGRCVAGHRATIFSHCPHDSWHWDDL